MKDETNQCNWKFARLPLFKVNELLNDIRQSTSIVTRDSHSMIGDFSSGFSVVGGKPYNIWCCNKFFVEFAFEI